jgi:hypothetical protein
MAALRLVDYAEAPRRSRWLRIVDEGFDSGSAVA